MLNFPLLPGKEETEVWSQHWQVRQKNWHTESQVYKYIYQCPNLAYNLYTAYVTYWIRNGRLKVVFPYDCTRHIKSWRWYSLCTLREVWQHFKVGVWAPPAGVDKSGSGGGGAPAAPLWSPPAYSSSTQTVDCGQSIRVSDAWNGDRWICILEGKFMLDSSSTKRELT